MPLSMGVVALMELSKSALSAGAVASVFSIVVPYASSIEVYFWLLLVVKAMNGLTYYIISEIWRSSGKTIIYLNEYITWKKRTYYSFLAYTNCSNIKFSNWFDAYPRKQLL